jgi:hypothetical protein
MQLTGDAGNILIADDTLIIDGVAREQVKFSHALSAGSHHDDWFTAMLPDVVCGFRDPTSAEGLLGEAAECLAIIRNAYEAAATPLVTRT